VRVSTEPSRPVAVGDQPLLKVENLSIGFDTGRGTIWPSVGTSFSIARGEIVGIVGESGSGKSVLARSIVRLLDPKREVRGGSIRFEGRDILQMSEAEFAELRARKISMVFQDPTVSLNPVQRIGKQISRILYYSRRRKYAAAAENEDLSIRHTAINLLRDLMIPDPDFRFRQYPHQFSGGMRQRVMMAMALICKPSLVIADEPTTALDVTVEAQILHLLRQLREKSGTSILFISHDLGVVSQLCDRVLVYYAGHVVESGPVDTIFHDPLHPYTQALLWSIPRGTKHDGRLQPLPGDPPDLADLPEGCPFRRRCRYAVEGCAATQVLRGIDASREVACHMVLPK